MKCPQCSETMIEIAHPEVTVDKCLRCKGLWFDMEEVLEYASLKTPFPFLIPTDEVFRQHTRGEKEVCPCCEENALQLGSISGCTYKRCSWCGGIFIEMDKFRRLIKAPSSSGESVGVGEAALGVLEILGIVAELFWA